jgi:signal transduction histidine kinase
MFTEIRRHTLGQAVRDDRSLDPIHVSSHITRDTRSDQSRAELRVRLIEAQEQERKRIAQEIHDDFSQRFALALIKLQAVSDASDNPQTHTLLEDAVEEMTRLATDLQSLSHRLYSPRLKILGLARNLMSLCEDVSRDVGIEIVCDHSDVPDGLSDRTVLVIFRVAQEALHNIVKHSEASKVDVRLTGATGRISLTIFDNGTGLKPRRRDASDGVGIASMRERVLMLGGEFHIDTRPSVEGTRIVATVPTAQDG